MEVQKLSLESNFSKKTRRRGGKSKAEAISRANVAVEKTKPKYHLWVEEYIVTLNALFAKAKSAPEFDRETLDAAYLKTAHIRNLGSTFGHEMATEVADRLCELLYRLMDLEFCHGPAITALFDALKLVTSNDEFHGVSSKVYAGFLIELDKVINLFPVVQDKSDTGKNTKSPKTVH